MRLAAFAAVGALGFVVQMAILARLLAARCPYLIATALAIEIAAIHNFVWHERWTWADRTPGGDSVLRRFFRFNAATGSASLPAGVAFTAAYVRSCGGDPMTANIIAVVLAAALSFTIADGWVFYAPTALTEIPAASNPARSRAAS